MACMYQSIPNSMKSSSLLLGVLSVGLHEETIIAARNRMLILRDIFILNGFCFFYFVTHNGISDMLGGLIMQEII